MLRRYLLIRITYFKIIESFKAEIHVSKFVLNFSENRWLLVFHLNRALRSDIISKYVNRKA